MLVVISWVRHHLPQLLEELSAARQPLDAVLAIASVAD